MYNERFTSHYSPLSSNKLHNVGQSSPWPYPISFQITAQPAPMEAGLIILVPSTVHMRLGLTSLPYIYISGPHAAILVPKSSQK